MKIRVITLIILVTMLVLPVSLYAQETDATAVIMARAEALNAGDAEAATALFADDASYDISDPQLDFYLSLAGKDEIGARNAELVAVNASLEVEIRQVEGGAITALAKFLDDGLRSEGIAYIEGIEEYTIQNGKITSYKWTTQGVVTEAPPTLPESGGEPFPTYTLMLAMGGVLLLGSLGLALRRRLS